MTFIIMFRQVDYQSLSGLVFLGSVACSAPKLAIQISQAPSGIGHTACDKGCKQLRETHSKSPCVCVWKESNRWKGRKSMHQLAATLINWTSFKTIEKELRERARELQFETLSGANQKRLQWQSSSSRFSSSHYLFYSITHTVSCTGFLLPFGNVNESECRMWVEQTKSPLILIWVKQVH